MAEEQVARTSVSAADAEEYTQSLAQHLTADWRQIELAKRMGIPEALGLSVKEWVETRLGGYLKQGVTARLEAVKELQAQGYTQRETAEIIGVSQDTVSRTARDERKRSEDPETLQVSAPEPARVERNRSTPEEVETPICQGVTAKGTPCKKKSVDNSTFCKDHNPLRLAEKEIDSLELQLQQAEEEMEKDKADYESQLKTLRDELMGYRSSNAEHLAKAKQEAMAQLTDQERARAQKEADAWAQEQGQAVLRGFSNLVSGQVITHLEEATKALKRVAEQGGISKSQLAQIDEAHAAFNEELNITRMSELSQGESK